VRRPGAQAGAQVLLEGRLVPDELAAARAVGDVLLDERAVLADELTVEERVDEVLDVGADHGSPPSRRLRNSSSEIGASPLMIPCSTA
jgi:hypothetical protein